MIIDCVSDLHGSYPELEGGDVLIIAGDLTARDYLSEYIPFMNWLSRQNYHKIIIVAGNHDGCIQDKSFQFPKSPTWSERISYLEDSGVEFEGLKIWGSPWTPTFYDWHFMKNRGAAIKEKWDLIPEDTDILITHGPPYRILDCPFKIPASKHDCCGCQDLRDAVERIKPRLHVFGHIHGGYGKEESFMGDSYYVEEVIFVNASHMNEDYESVNKPIRVIL